MKIKSVAVLLVVVLSLLAFGWWKVAAEASRLLKTIDVRTASNFGSGLSVNRDGSQFASGVTQDGDQLIIWDSNGFPRNRFTKRRNSLVDIQLTQRSHRGFIRQIVFSPDWDAFVWCRQRRSPLSALGIWWFNRDSEMSPRLTQFSTVECVAVGDSPDEQIAIQGFNEQTKSREVYVRNNSKPMTLDGLTEYETLKRIAFSPDGSRLIAVSGRRNAFMWDLNTGKLAFTIEKAENGSHQYGNDNLVFSQDSKRFALWEDVGVMENAIRIRSSLDGSIEKEFKHEDVGLFLGFSSDFKWYVVKVYSGLNIHSLEDGRLVHAIAEPTSGRSEFIDAAFSGDSRRLVTSSYDRSYRIWDLTNIDSP